MFNQQPQIQPQYVMMPPQQQPMFLMPPAQSQLSATDVLLLMNAMASHSPSVSQQVVIPGPSAAYLPGPQIQAAPPATLTAHAGETDAKLAALKTKHAEGALAAGDLRIDVEQLVSESVDSGWRALESIAAEMEQKDAVTAGVVKHCLDSAKEKLNHVLTATHKGVAQTQDGHNLIHLGSSATRSVLMIVSKGFAELFEHQGKTRPEQPTVQVKQQPEDSRVQKSPLAVASVDEDPGAQRPPPRSSQAAAAGDEDAAVQKQRRATPTLQYRGQQLRRRDAQMPVIHVNVHSPHPVPPQQIHHHHGVIPAPSRRHETHHHHYAPPPPAVGHEMHHHHHHVITHPVPPLKVHHHHNAQKSPQSGPFPIVESDEAEIRANEEDVGSGSGNPDLPPNPRQDVRRNADTNIAGNVAGSFRGASKPPQDDDSVSTAADSEAGGEDDGEIVGKPAVPVGGVRQAAVVKADAAREDEEEEREEMQADRDDALAVAKPKGKADLPPAPLVSADESEGDEDYVETGESSNKAPVVMGNRIPPAKESVDDSAQGDVDDEEGEDYDDDDDDSGTEAERAEPVVSPLVDATNDTNGMDADDLAFEEEVQDAASADVPAVEKSPPHIRVVLNRRMTLPSGKTPY